MHNNSQIASHNLQSHLSSLQTRYRDWKTKINEPKSCHTSITFILKQGISPYITLNNVQVSSSNTIKYRCGLYIKGTLCHCHDQDEPNDTSFVKIRQRNDTYLKRI